MIQAHRRHDISDEVWSKTESHLPGQKGLWGGVAKDNRNFINTVMWIFRTGSPWRDLPPDYGGWSNVHRRFCRWRDNGVWERLLNIFINDPDFEWLMIDSTFVKVHKSGFGAIEKNQAVSRTKGGSIQRYIWPWMRMVCRSELLLQKVPEMIARRLVN